MTKCPECSRLREESALAFSEYVVRKDELAMTSKKDKEFPSRRRAFERAEGQLREAHTQETNHRAEWHTDSADPAESLGIEQKFGVLGLCLELGDADSVQQAILDLSPRHNGSEMVPDEIVGRLLTLLRREEMYSSNLAGHVLNYFEFNSPQLTPRQKSPCIGFLNAHGNQFTHAHSQQVVSELRHDDYLK